MQISTAGIERSRLPRMMQFALGTHNRKKLVELQELLGDLPVELVTLADLPHAIAVNETGITFVENARLKASEQARHLQMWVLAEDSGISVDALHGRPGVYSARFAGPTASDEDNNRRLLHELTAVPQAARSAHYTCQLCLAEPSGEIVLEATGECHGVICDHPRGNHGFGYDPLFLIPEYHKTFGQLGGTVKRAISHRARAMRRFRMQLQQLLTQQSAV